MTTGTINDQGLFYLHPGGSGSPHTVQFPDSGLLEEGREVGILLMAFDSTSVTLTSNPSTSADEIQDPTSLFSAFSSTLSSLDLSAISFCSWVLVKSGVVNNTWRVISIVK